MLHKITIHHHALPDNLMIFGSHTISFAWQIIKYPARIRPYINPYAPRILLFPIAEKHIAINKAQCQWHGLCSNLLRTIDKGLFVYAILYLRDGDIDYFPESKIIFVFSLPA